MNKKKDDSLNFKYFWKYFSFIFILLIFIALFSKTTDSQCVSNLVNGTFGEWKDISGCTKDGEITQRRGTVQYDTNNCGEFKDKIVEEYRTIKCEYVESGLIEQLKNNILIFSLLFLLILVLIIILGFIFFYILRAHNKNKELKNRNSAILIKKEYEKLPRSDSLFMRLNKNIKIYFERRRLLKEERKKQKLQQLERERRFELQKKEKEKIRGLELEREKRRKESENKRLELEKERLKNERRKRFKSIFSSFGRGINHYFERRRLLKEERKRRKEEQKLKEEKERIRLAKEKEVEIFNLINQRKEKEKVFELELMREKKGLEAEKRKVILEKERLRNERRKRFKSIFSSFDRGINHYFERRRLLKEERRENEKKEDEDNRKRELEFKRSKEEKEKEIKALSFEEKYYPPERLAKTKSQKEESEKYFIANQKPLFVENKNFIKNDIIPKPQKEEKNYLIEKKLRERQNKIIRTMIEEKKKNIGNIEKTRKISQDRISKPKVTIEIPSVYSRDILKKSSEKKNLENEIAPKIDNKYENNEKEYFSYDEKKPNMEIDLGMNRMNAPDNSFIKEKAEFYRNISDLFSKGEEALNYNNIDYAKEIYERMKSIYNSEYDNDNIIHQRIISFYHKIIDFINSNN